MARESIVKLLEGRQSVTQKLLIEVSNISKTFQTKSGPNCVLDKVNLNIYEGDFICVVGPSGCGKTTLLNILGGLTQTDEGIATHRGVPIAGPSPDRGVIFQQYALFPWKTVIENVAFGLKLKKIRKKERHERALHYLDLVGLTKFKNAYPKELSGGMKQRVAIARAYATDPEILLMDEPFGALDAQTRGQLQEELLKTWEKEKKTIFFITHDVEEAVILANRVIMMKANPGGIKHELKIDLPYPRSQETKLLDNFTKLKNEVWLQVYHHA
ncbi:ABC transporter ATP-binding protein [Fodinisporobacter ferrooxydans]|uniref:ABC transporter ATP-binding protein n=1 Tax=Fodinisporobacter ferrooxydans TaxID=2901836 RepID=A0ABY4CDZ4_9BACL|nr:ABC transporter ATP-binding protein [Alicyclobacillaceae bacterium MYW30-H2]